MKKQSERVTENKGLDKKQTENKAKTKLPKLLKTKEGSKKQTENKPKNKAGRLIENKRPSKNKPKENHADFATFALLWHLPYASAVFQLEWQVE